MKITITIFSDPHFGHYSFALEGEDKGGNYLKLSRTLGGYDPLIIGEKIRKIISLALPFEGDWDRLPWKFREAVVLARIKGGARLKLDGGYIITPINVE